MGEEVLAKIHWSCCQVVWHYASVQDKEKLCCFDARNQQCHVPGGALSALTIRIKKDRVESRAVLVERWTLLQFRGFIMSYRCRDLVVVANWQLVRPCSYEVFGFF